MMDIVIKEKEGHGIVYVMNGDRPIYCHPYGYELGNDIITAKSAANIFVYHNDITITRTITEHKGYERVQLPDDSSLLF